MKKTLYIIRGLPGSGKSSLAKLIASSITKSNDYECKHYEADMYFIDSDGNYKWEASKIHLAHSWCFNSVEAELMSGRTTIVSNIFARQSEVKPYVELAKQHNFSSFIVTANNNFGNIHNVPVESLEKMKRRFHHGDIE